LEESSSKTSETQVEEDKGSELSEIPKNLEENIPESKGK
jgi:hypothetical protein